MAEQIKELISDLRTDQSFGIIPICRDRESGTIKFLLIQHRFGEHWAFPKGHAEADESGMQAAMREFTEETGIEGVIIDASIYFDESYMRPNGMGLKGVRYWIGSVSNPKVKVQEKEVQAYRWVTARQGQKLITYDENREVLKRAFAYLDKDEA